LYPEYTVYPVDDVYVCHKDEYEKNRDPEYDYFEEAAKPMDECGRLIVHKIAATLFFNALNPDHTLACFDNVAEALNHEMQFVRRYVNPLATYGIPNRKFYKIKKKGYFHYINAGLKKQNN
jgi:hypothetical protein